MNLSVTGFLLFVLPHAFSSLFPAIRDRAMAWAGATRFKAGHAALALLGVIFMVWAYWQSRSGGAGVETLYDSVAGAKFATLLLAPIGFVFIIASVGRSHLKLWLQNPMSIGVALWATGHLITSGKASVVWFFAALLLVAIMDIASSLARGKRPTYDPRWQDDIKAVVVGIVLVAIVAGLFHPYVLGVRL